MPFLKLNNNWSKIAQYYNQSFNNKPEVPTLKYTAFDDGLIRGGVLNATLASTRDTARVGKFLASGKGVLFITKQVGLQLSNPLLEQDIPKDNFGKLGTNTKSNLLNKASSAINTATTAINGFINKRTPNQIYNLGLNTLTQIPLMAFGGHIIRQGTLLVGGGGYLEGNTDGIKGYNYAVITKRHNEASKQAVNTVSSNTNTSTTNSSVNTAATGAVSRGSYTNYTITKNQTEADKIQAKLEGFNMKIPNVARKETLEEVIISGAKSKIPSSLSYQNAPNRLLTYFRFINTDYTSGTPKITGYVNGITTLQDYNGGPGSTYGIGKTIITTYPDQRTNISNKKEDPKKELLNGFVATSYAAIDNLSTILSSDRKNQTYINTNKEDNVEDRIGVSKIGKRNSPITSVDAINTISITDETTFYNTSKTGTLNNSDPAASSLFTYTAGSTEKVQSGYFGRDIIKFRIEFLNNDTNKNEVLAFRAYIDDFNDGVQAKWNSYRYMGRGEDFYVYDGFTRDMNVAFTIHAHSPAEMAPIYQKLNYLMSAFAPDYNSANKMRGNIGYLTVGDYIYRQPGIFTDIKLSGMLETHWEISLNKPEGVADDTAQYEVPKHIKVNLSFKPIHNFLPRRVSITGDKAIKNDKSPFITPNSTSNKYLKV